VLSCETEENIYPMARHQFKIYSADM